MLRWIPQRGLRGLHAAQHTTVAVSLTGLKTPDTGTVGLRLGQITYDGDRGWKDHVDIVPNKGAAFELGDVQSPVDDVQNSVLANNDPHDSNFQWARTPNYQNTLGYDNHRFLLDGNAHQRHERTDHQLPLYPSTGEGTNIGVIFAAVDLAP
ncbi:hypothetical protein ABIA32_000053 [Streptacidiphilus sp. MAP12-20]|uniref:hypothetical protein n=1 Tax=Streptacidiphilus sp. MAP12-20 TaxID=3156299 RepID=UPI0035135509